MPEQNKIKGDNNTTTVVRILSESRVAINKKPIADIHMEDQFLLYELTEEIIDPISNENLGQLKLYKGTGKVVDIQDTMAIVQSDRESLKSPLFSAAQMLYEGRPEKILMPFNNPKVGDMAERIIYVKDGEIL